jgi:hypothetical protein
MGNKTFSRKGFLKSFSENEPVNFTETLTGEGPLFKKYARTSLSPRHYSNENVVHRLAMDEFSLRTGNVTSGLAPYIGAWTEWEALHLVRHTNFGWKKSYVDTCFP